MVIIVFVKNAVMPKTRANSYVRHPIRHHIHAVHKPAQHNQSISDQLISLRRGNFMINKTA